jgi:hypothetical protein
VSVIAVLVLPKLEMFSCPISDFMKSRSAILEFLHGEANRNVFQLELRLSLKRMRVEVMSIVFIDSEANSDSERRTIHKLIKNKVPIPSKIFGAVEIQARIAAGNGCCFTLQRILKSKSISRKTKLAIYKTIIKSIVTYARET